MSQRPQPSQNPERRTLIAALLLAAVAQALALARLLGGVAFLLDLAAVLALRRILAVVPTRRQAAASSAASDAGGARALGWALAIAGGVGAAACSLTLTRDFAPNLMTVLIVGPLTLASLALGCDLLAGRRYSLAGAGRRWTDWWRQPSNRLLLVILLGGALFRFGSVGHFPPPAGISSIEEMQRASGGFNILLGDRPWEFPLAQYLNAASFALFGVSIYAVRLPATFLAWVTLAVFHALARRLVNVRAALFATALLAVSRWHCQVAWYNEDVYVPLLPFTALLFCLVATRDDPRPSLYVAAGALCGYLLYDYAAFRGSILIALLFFAVDAIWQRRRPADWGSIAGLVAVTALFALPLLGVLDEHRGGKGFYFEALARSFADARYYTSEPLAFLQQRLQRIQAAAASFVSTDGGNFFPTLNVRFMPLLDPLTGIAFVLGFGVTLLQPRRRYYAFFSLAFLLLATGAMVVTWNLDFRRLAILIPFVFVFVAFLVSQLEDLAEARGAGRALGPWLTAVALATAAVNGVFLFAFLAPDPLVRFAHHNAYIVPADYLLRHHRGEYVVLLSPEVPNFFESTDYDWMKPPGLRGRVALAVEEILPFHPSVPGGRATLLLIARPFHIPTVMAQVADLYPRTTCELRRHADSELFDLGVCRIPKASSRSAVR